MRKFIRFTGLAAGGVTVFAAMTWAALVLWYSLQTHEWIRYGLIAATIGLGLGGVCLGILKRRFVISLTPFAACFVAVLAWFLNVQPSNERDWQPNVAVLPSAEIKGNFVTLRNIRNFKYRSETDYTPQWYNKTVDMRQLDSLDLIAVYWAGDAIAHTILSFNFGGEYVAISIEIRKEKGESFSALAGFFRRYELTYVVGDERDLIGLRAVHRIPKEDVYLYRVNPRHKENIGKLFLRYMNKINSLRHRPEFYNTATTNCTTNIVTHIEAARGSTPLSWKMLLSGYFPDLFYERGVLDKSLPFAELRRKSLINERALAADGAENFSKLIRQGLIGMSSVQAPNK